MKENKDIERLFQEKFKDFEVTPPEMSWSTIASKIEQKKKKRRGIPFWLKASGIAASLFIGLFLIFNQEIKSVYTDDNNAVVYENDSKNKDGKNTSIQKEEIVLKKDFEVVENEANSSSNKKYIPNEIQKTKQNNLIENQKDIIFQKDETSIVSSSNNKKRITKKEINNSLITSESNKNSDFDNQSDESKIVSHKEIDSSYNHVLVELNENKTPNDKNTSDNDISNLLLKENLIVETNISDTEKTNSSNPSENSIVNSAKKSHLEIDLKNNSILEEAINNNQKNVFDSKKLLIADVKFSNKEQNNTETEIKNDKTNPLLNIEKLNNGSKDSTTVITQVEAEVNALEQLLKEKEVGKNADEKEEEKRSKWAVSSNAAPVYFNSISNGSPIDEQFANNEKNYAQTLSYGVGLQYAITKKISIRSGVNTININYNTNDVYYSSTLGEVNSSSLNIAKNGNAQNLILRSNPSAQSASLLSTDVDNLVDSNLANLNQEMGYIEVPLELTYKILDKKFGIEVIGGMSTLFLNKNTVSLVSRGSEMTIGEANNLNNIHFSSNVGLGFNYNFWKAFHLNFQPVFKYQINTFNSNSGNFKPYIIGLYSGVSFNF